MKVDCSGSLSFAIRGIPSSIQPAIRHSGEGRNPEGWGGVRPPDDGKNSPVAPFSSSHAVFTSPWSFRPPNSSLVRKCAAPFEPAGLVIAMKACPGARSGIDRCGSLSFAIRGIPSSIRSLIRHSSEGWNPGGEAWGETNIPWKNRPAWHHLHSLMLRGLHNTMLISAKSLPRTPIRWRSPSVGSGKCSAVEDFARRGACPPPRRAGLPTGPSGLPIRHSREGENPRTNTPRTNVDRETTNDVDIAAPTVDLSNTNTRSERREECGAGAYPSPTVRHQQICILSHGVAICFAQCQQRL